VFFFQVPYSKSVKHRFGFHGIPPPPQGSRGWGFLPFDCFWAGRDCILRFSRGEPDHRFGKPDEVPAREKNRCRPPPIQGDFLTFGGKYQFEFSGFEAVTYQSELFRNYRADVKNTPENRF